MRRCPICGSSFDDEACYCPLDGCCLAPTEERGPLAGVRIDERYYIEQRIGAGGLGEVYRARHVKMGKLFALKVLCGAARADEQMQARFDREARVLSRLRHPFCVEVIDYGHCEHGPYIVMELVAGDPLSRYTKGEGLALGQALELMLKVLAGLGHAHDQGIIHRDVKPDNIMIVTSPTGDGTLEPKVLDFGLAKLQPGYLETGDVEALTAPGKVIGTPAYLAPERVVAARGEPIDQSVDLYAAGVILYELACGKRPFFADDLAGIVRQHLLLAPPPPRTVRPELPAALEAVILKALAKKPAERFTTAAEFSAALSACLPLDPRLASQAPPAAQGRSTPPPRLAPDAIIDETVAAAPAAARPVAPGDDATRVSSRPAIRSPLYWAVVVGAPLLLLVLATLLYLLRSR